MDAAQGAMQTAPMVMTEPIDPYVALVAAVIGIVAIALIWRMNRQMGGKMRWALWWFALGIFSNVFAMVYTSLFGHEYTIGSVTFGVHDALMTVGMVLFILSAYQFTRLIPRV